MYVFVKKDQNLVCRQTVQLIPKDGYKDRERKKKEKGKKKGREREKESSRGPFK